MFFLQRGPVQDWALRDRRSSIRYLWQIWGLPLASRLLPKLTRIKTVWKRMSCKPAHGAAGRAFREGAAIGKEQEAGSATGSCEARIVVVGGVVARLWDVSEPRERRRDILRYRSLVGLQSV